MHSTPVRSLFRRRPTTAAPLGAARSRRSAFTLLEVLLATTIFSVAMGITLVAYLAVLKRAVHTEKMLEGASQLRFASDMISEAVRSASQDPVIAASGTQLIVAPPEMGYLVVQDGTWLDSPLNTVKGTKSGQRNLKLSVTIPSAVLELAFAGAARPTGALTGADIATYFRPNTSFLPQVAVDDVLASGDTVVIPATPFGQEVQPVINQISNSSNGTQTVTMTSNITADVPNGTRIRMLHGRRQMFEVTAGGDLRYYPEYRADDDRGTFSILARNIEPRPFTDHTNPASARTVPFANSARVVTITLQQTPKGTTAGRTVQGVRTTAYARTDPTVQ